MSVIKPQEINLDFTQNSYKDIVVKQNDIDSRSVIVTCTNNGIKCPLDRVTNICNIKMETPDGRAIYNPTTILSDGRVQIDFTEQMVLVGGKVDAELEIIDANSQQIIHTMNLYVVVVSNVYDNDEIVATPEFDALNEALLAVQDCSELVESVREIEENERIREENEAQRAQEFEQMKNDVANVGEHYTTIASKEILGHVKIDDKTIKISEDGVISSVGTGQVPNGVVYIDFENSENNSATTIEKLNGIKIYHTDDNRIMASWENDGTQEVELVNNKNSGYYLSFPLNLDGSINYGEPGQFIISTGTKTVEFITIDHAEGGAY